MATRDYSNSGASIVSDKDSFADLDLNFTAHPVTEDIVAKKDANAIRQSVKNILLTNHYERPFKPNFGANLRGMLFEANDPLMGHRIKESIVNALAREGFKYQKDYNILCVPNIVDISYGRGVGYTFTQHDLGKDVHNISATKIRAEMREQGKL